MSKPLNFIEDAGTDRDSIMSTITTTTLAESVTSVRSASHEQLMSSLLVKVEKDAKQVRLLREKLAKIEALPKTDTYEHDVKKINRSIKSRQNDIAIAELSISSLREVQANDAPPTPKIEPVPTRLINVEVTSDDSLSDLSSVTHTLSQAGMFKGKHKPSSNAKRTKPESDPREIFADAGDPKSEARMPGAKLYAEWEIKYGISLKPVRIKPNRLPGESFTMSTLEARNYGRRDGDNRPTDRMLMAHGYFKEERRRLKNVSFEDLQSAANSLPSKDPAKVEVTLEFQRRPEYKPRSPFVPYNLNQGSYVPNEGWVWNTRP